MDRPNNLPEFTNPPLNEVVLGVQFDPCPTFTQIHAHAVWALFRGEFPKVQEQTLLEPQFETFGGGSLPGMNVKFGPPPLHSRLWFSAQDNSHLFQFQDDRLLLNWRSLSDKSEYPRYDVIAPKFKTYLADLVRFFDEELSHVLTVNQAEVTYVNLIPCSNFGEIDNWLSIFKLGTIHPEVVSASFSEVISKEDKGPLARLFCEVHTVMSTDDKKSLALRLALTFRGLPESNQLSDVMDFLNLGRVSIVNRFTELTTEQAHKTWGRIK